MRSFEGLKNVTFVHILSLAVFCFVIAGSSVLVKAQSDRLPPGLELLKTTKEEMARSKSSGDRTYDEFYGEEYQIAGRRVRAKFASERCSWHGWDVPPGTLISLNLLPEEKRTIDTRKLMENGYELYVIDTFDQFYASDRTGLVYFVHERTKELLGLTFYPSRSAGAAKLCKGFPEYRVLPKVYNVYETIDDLGDLDDWDVGLIGDLAGRVKADPALTGYVFIYSTDPCAESVARLKSRMEKWLFAAFEISSKQIKIVSGGVRDKDTIDLHLLSTTSPPATPYAKNFRSCEPG